MRTPDRENQELMRKTQCGDRQAFAKLHRKFRKRIFNYLYRYLGSYEAAEEITQDTFMNVFLKAHTFRLGERVSPWLYRIAINLAKNRIRSMRREKGISLDAPFAEEEKNGLLEMIKDEKTGGPDDLLRRRELELEIMKVINELPDNYKSALVLCELQGLSYDEAAEILHCTPNVIGVHLSRARTALRKKMKWGMFNKGTG